MSFKYKKSKFDNYKFKKGKVTAVIGNSNCGKSTYMQMLIKKYKDHNIMFANIFNYYPPLTNYVKQNLALYKREFFGNKLVDKFYLELVLKEFLEYIELVDKTKPEYLFLDEVETIIYNFSNKNFDYLKKFINLVKKTTKKNNIKTVLISHNKEILYKCDDVIHLPNKKGITILPTKDYSYFEKIVKKIKK